MFSQGADALSAQHADSTDVDLADYLADCVLTDAPPESDGADGVADIEAAEAIYESAETGRNVKIDN